MSSAYTKREALEKVLVLLQRPHGATIQDLMAITGRDRATVYRYISDMEADYAVLRADDGRFRVDPGVSLANVRLTPFEAQMVYLALRRLIQQTHSVPQYMHTALGKVIPTLRRKDLVGTLQDNLKRVVARRPMTEAEEEIWLTLIQGWIDQRVVKIDYLKAEATATEEHVCEPLLFEPMPFGDGVYLLAWSRTRDALRTFKVERIQAARATVTPFAPRELSVDDLVRHAWGIWYGQSTVQVVLRFAPSKARRVMESRYHHSEVKETQPDGSVLWSVEVAATRELSHWVLGWGAGVEVLEPASLRDEIAAEHRAAAAHYGDADA